MTKEIKLLSLALCAWTACTLSFMAAMGIGSGLLVLASCWALRNDLPLVKKCFSSPLAMVTLGYFIISFLSLLAAKLSPPLGLAPESMFGLKKFHFFILPFLAALALVKTSGSQLAFEKHPMWRALFWMGIFVSLIGIIQFWGAYLFPASWLDDRFFRNMATGNSIPVFHAQGLMYFHLSFASAMGFVCSYAWGRVLWPLDGDDRSTKNVCLAFALLTTLAFFYTYSRISWVALVAMIVTLGFLKKPRWGFVSLAFCALAACCLWFGSENLRGRWNMGLGPILEREQVWMAAIGMIKDRPILGVGFGQTGHYSEIYAEHILGHKPILSSHAHNNFLDVTAATGVLGLLAFLAWWIVLWRYLWRAFQESDNSKKWLPASCLAAFVTFQINGLTQVNFYDGKSEHSLMLWAGIALALHWRGSQIAGSKSNIH